MKRAALLVAASAFVYFGLHARAADDPAESGVFALFKFEQEIGEERYDIRSSAGSFTLTSTFSFNDRGTPVPLDTDPSIRPRSGPHTFHDSRRRRAHLED